LLGEIFRWLHKNRAEGMVQCSWATTGMDGRSASQGGGQAELLNTLGVDITAESPQKGQGGWQKKKKKGGRVLQLIDFLRTSEGSPRGMWRTVPFMMKCPGLNIRSESRRSSNAPPRTRLVDIKRGGGCPYRDRAQHGGIREFEERPCMTRFQENLKADTQRAGDSFEVSPLE